MVKLRRCPVSQGAGTCDSPRICTLLLSHPDTVPDTYSVSTPGILRNYPMMEGTPLAQMGTRRHGTSGNVPQAARIQTSCPVAVGRECGPEGSPAARGGTRLGRFARRAGRRAMRAPPPSWSRLPLAPAGWGRPRVEGSLRPPTPRRIPGACVSALGFATSSAPSAPSAAWRGKLDSRGGGGGPPPGPRAGLEAHSCTPERPRQEPASPPPAPSFRAARALRSPREGAGRAGTEGSDSGRGSGREAWGTETPRPWVPACAPGILTTLWGQALPDRQKRPWGSVTTPQVTDDRLFLCKPLLEWGAASGAWVQIPVVPRFSHLENGDQSSTCLSEYCSNKRDCGERVCARDGVLPRNMVADPRAHFDAGTPTLDTRSPRTSALPTLALSGTAWSPLRAAQIEVSPPAPGPPWRCFASGLNRPWRAQARRGARVGARGRQVAPLAPTEAGRGSEGAGEAVGREMGWKREDGGGGGGRGREVEGWGCEASGALWGGGGRKARDHGGRGRSGEAQGLDGVRGGGKGAGSLGIRSGGRVPRDR